MLAGEEWAAGLVVRWVRMVGQIFVQCQSDMVVIGWAGVLGTGRKGVGAGVLVSVVVWPVERWQVCAVLGRVWASWIGGYLLGVGGSVLFRGTWEPTVQQWTRDCLHRRVVKEP